MGVVKIDASSREGINVGSFGWGFPPRHPTQSFKSSMAMKRTLGRSARAFEPSHPAIQRSKRAKKLRECGKRQKGLIEKSPTVRGYSERKVSPGRERRNVAMVDVALSSRSSNGPRCQDARWPRSFLRLDPEPGDTVPKSAARWLSFQRHGVADFASRVSSPRLVHTAVRRRQEIRDKGKDVPAVFFRVASVRN